MKAFVYFDYHRKCWSIRDLATGLVVNYRGQGKGRTKILTQVVCLRACTFKVSERGRQEVLRTKQKNIHAGVVGTVCRLTAAQRRNLTKQVTYNPYKYSSFVEKATETPIHEAPVALLLNGRVFVEG
jgi:hypothetical protein